MTKTQTEYLERVAKRSRRTFDDVAELWNERAAHREYDAGMRRVDAERRALDDVADVVLR
jgi:hypothetical protein